MLWSVIQFPGSNCDSDCLHAISIIAGNKAQLVWHKETVLPNETKAVIVPGGFSYGDYLRAGCIAAHSPIMGAVREFADRGGLVLGICNGFQVLTEARLLPGALMQNRSLKFICKPVHLKLERADSSFTADYSKQNTSVLTMPVAHMDGNYVISEKDLVDLETNRQIVFRYCNANGEVTSQNNPNGSVSNIAGVCNKAGNVLGMMPHPERVVETMLGGSDGLGIFQSMIERVRNG